MSYTVSTIMRWPTIPSMAAITAAVGIVFGYCPVLKVTRLDPIEALRYE